MDRATGAIDRQRLRSVKAREDERFATNHPASMALLARARRSMPRGVPMQWMASTYGHPPVFSAVGKGAHFRCVDGHRYLDMGLALLVNFGGYAPAPVVSAVTRQVRRGSHFALPAEDAIYVAEELSHRFGLPSWQFTLSATLANAEAIRLARAATGRERILLFDGKYHGHLEQTMQIIVDGETRPEYLGLARDAGASTSIVQFNDLPAVETMLARDDVACVITEPAMTLERTFLPEPGFHSGLRTLTRQAGTLLVLDETHTQTQHFGGLTRAWGLEPDIVVLGKSLGGGIPIGAYGMTKHLADVLEAPGGDPIVGYGEGQFVGEPIAELATGGTMFANAFRWQRRGPLSNTSTPRRRTLGPTPWGHGWQTGSARSSSVAAFPGASCDCSIGRAITSLPTCPGTRSTNARRKTRNSPTRCGSTCSTGAFGRPAGGRILSHRWLTPPQTSTATSRSSTKRSASSRSGDRQPSLAETRLDGRKGMRSNGVMCSCLDRR